MTTFFVVVASTILSVYMAERRGRSLVLAVVGGLMFGIFAPLYYLIAGDSQEKRAEKKLHKEAMGMLAAKLKDLKDEPVAPVKRPRGRPRKIVDNVDTQ